MRDPLSVDWVEYARRGREQRWMIPRTCRFCGHHYVADSKERGARCPRCDGGRLKVKPLPFVIGPHREAEAEPELQIEPQSEPALQVGLQSRRPKDVRLCRDCGGPVGPYKQRCSDCGAKRRRQQYRAEKRRQRERGSGVLQKL